MGKKRGNSRGKVAISRRGLRGGLILRRGNHRSVAKDKVEEGFSRGRTGGEKNQNQKRIFDKVMGGQFWEAGGIRIRRGRNSSCRRGKKTGGVGNHRSVQTANRDLCLTTLCMESLNLPRKEVKKAGGKGEGGASMGVIPGSASVGLKSAVQSRNFSRGRRG